MALRSGSQILFCELPVRLDTYQGCSHACSYCFVQRHGKYNLSDIVPKEESGALRRFIKGERTSEVKWCDWNIPVHWGGVSEPFQPCEKVHRTSLAALKVFADTGYPFVVSTKGALIAEAQYIDLLRRTNSVVQISAVCSMYDKLEPGAPAFEERLKLMERISPHVRRVIVRIQSFYPEALNDVLANIPRLANAGVYGVTVEGMKFSKKKPGACQCRG